MDELPSWLPVDDWHAFVEMRNKIKAPLTDYAVDLAIRRLDRLRLQGEDPGEILQQSIFNAWRGLFPARERDGNSNGKLHRKSELASAFEDVIDFTRKSCDNKLPA